MNNIMWFKRGDEIVGVLCDWDLAEDHSNGDLQAVGVGKSGVVVPGKGKGKAVPSRRSQCIANKSSNPQDGEGSPATSEEQVQPRHRTGTSPFMAVDLLVLDTPPLHKYRHDLESFFYIYMCAAATFDPDREPKILVIEAWNSHNLRVVGSLKRTFLFDITDYQAKLQHAHADFKPMVNGSLARLYALFGEVEHLAVQIQRTHINRFTQLFGGVNILGTNTDDLENQRDTLATYKNFMQMLQEPEEVD